MEGPRERDGSDEEWEQKFRRPSRPHDGHINEGLDMHAMLKEAFQEIDEAPAHPPIVEGQIADIVMGAFTIVDELTDDEVPLSDDESQDEPLGGKWW